MVTELIEKYVWLIETFIRAGERGLTLAELSGKWESRFSIEYSRSSFNRHREAIAEIFGIEIECNRSTRHYFIRYGDDVKDRDATAAWLIDTFTVSSLLSLGKERLSGRVSVEEIPSGHKYLTSVMDAMTENREIVIGYRKYTGDEISRYTLRPYAVKESARRWYIVAYCLERKQVRVYGMDRIMSLEATSDRFDMPGDFDVDRLFSTSFGVYLSDRKPEEIIFRASEKEARYIEDLPLHGSQKVLSRDGNYVTFSIFASENESLVMELLRLGPKIEVVAPESLRHEIARQASETVQIYGNKTK